MPSWTLRNAEALQKEAPYTYYRPSDKIIDLLKPGEATVKLVFAFEPDKPETPSAERMWVIIDSINEDGSYIGTLDNEPFHIKDLKVGDKITFRREHIIQYHTLDELTIEDELAEKIETFRKRCVVSNQIMKEGMPIIYIYRDKPSEEMDSGWNFMSGEENDEYADDPNNFQFISLGKVLNMDDSFVGLLEEPIGAEFARDEITGDFFPVEE